MALVPCPGCRFDTSDSLAVCPHCGAALGRRSQAPTESSPSDTRRARSGGPLPSSFGRLVVPILGLVVLLVAPKLLPLLFVLGIVWLLRKSRLSNRRGLQTETLQILLRQAGAGPRGPVGRPLERLRRIERQIGPTREA
jgi:hypothetical protein